MHTKDGGRVPEMSEDYQASRQYLDLDAVDDICLDNNTTIKYDAT